MTKLAERSCTPCRGGVEPLRGEALAVLKQQLPGWEVVEERRLHRSYKFPDFRTALAFVNLIGETAEAEGHHPDLELGWGKVEITLFTHAIGGLSESDFILAAKIDALPH